MVNVWKVSTLVLAGALAVVVGRGSLADAEACDSAADLPNTEQQTRLKLARALAFLERADEEVAQATAARPKERSDALVSISKARASLELALAPAATPAPKPRPRPMTKSVDLVDPFASPPIHASVSPTQVPEVRVVNPFLRASAETNASPRPSTPVNVVDPWAKRSRDPLDNRN
jgi:hypothetical protein